MDPQEIVDAGRARGIQIRVVDTVERCVDIAIGEAAEDSVVLISGSLYLVAAARTFLLR